MRRGRGLAILSALSVVSGCVYYNALYNAQRTWDRAEAARRAGDEEAARLGYEEVLERAALSYRKDPGGAWADDALHLLGLAYLRRGDLTRAGRAFGHVLETTESYALRASATLYLGVVVANTGDRARGVELLNQGLRTVDRGELRGEGHLWRARLLLADGDVDAGWWDLDRASEAHPHFRLPADLERLGWGVLRGDTARARLGAQRLLATPDAATRADSVRGLVQRAADAWGPRAAARLLRDAGSAPWPAAERSRMVLYRAELHARGGDTAAAVADVESVAAGAGPEAVTARLARARFEMAPMRAVADLDRVRPILLPGVGDPRVLELLRTLRQVELLERRAIRDADPVALFAAAELARDRLDARLMARDLFLRFAGVERAGRWEGKALLAALELCRTPEEAAPVRRRILGVGSDPYVQAREGLVGTERFQLLEEQLQAELDRVLEQTSAEAARTDVFLRGPGAGG